MDNCLRCRALLDPIEIRTPGGLREVLRKVRKAMDDGVLVVMPGAGDSVFPPPVEGPWGDIVHCRLCCTACGRGYCLFVETYHGRGGSWEPIKG